VEHHGWVPIDIELKPVESLVFRSEFVALGAFRCPAWHPLYRDSGPCSYHTFAFPRTATVIRHAEGATFVGTPNSVSLYNQHQIYSREKIDEIDASDWFVLSDDVLIDAIGSVDPGVADRPSRPFVHTHAPVDAGTYLEQRRLFDDVARGETDTLAIEEGSLRVFARVLASTYRTVVSRPQRDRIEAVKAIIASAPERNLSLRDLAVAVDISPYHLCRAFRRSAGMSITAYRHSLRLRRALDLVDGKGDLTDIALSLGYSSHSHFTSVFRRHFGITPSQYRARS
jgi:AraC family transcriptional regulator